MVKEEDLEDPTRAEEMETNRIKNKNSNENNKLKKKSLADCIYTVGTASQTSDYKVITEFDQPYQEEL